VHILLYNPNRSAHITERMAASARAELDGRHRLSAVTSTGGPLVVRDAATLQQADAEARRAVPLLMQDADALLLAISLDAVIDHLRPAVAPRPAWGLTEAAIAAAASLPATGAMGCAESGAESGAASRAVAHPGNPGGRVGLLTLGPGLVPLYRARLADLLPAARIAGIEAPDLPVAFEPIDPGAATVPGAASGPLVSPLVLPTLVAAGRRLVQSGADCIVLAGAVLCGYDQALQTALGVPVLDGVRCAMRQLQLEIASQSAGNS
jgi:allantoin racemase